MAFEGSVAPAVIDYINSCDRLRIIAGIFEELGDGADRFLAQNPHPFLPNRFWYDHVLMTEAHEVREFLFACSADGHVDGVTEVLYAEERPQEGA